MTDETRRPPNITYYQTTRRHTSAPSKQAGRVRSIRGDAPPAAEASRATPRRRPAVRGRIVATGIGIAAMVGLVANMEIASGRARPATPAPRVALVAPGSSNGSGTNVALGSAAATAAKQPRTIVLKPHVVVRTVGGTSGGSSGSSSGGSGYAAAPAAQAAPASAPAAAPAASTGGSH